MAVLRLARPDDARNCLDIYAPIVEETATSFETSIPTMEEFRTRITGTLERYPWLVSTDGGEVTGYAYAGPYRVRTAYQWSCEVSAYVARPYHRRGIGRALYETLFECLRTQGVVNAFAGVTLPNEHSVSFHEALGFEEVGVYRRVGYKFGAWHDVGWWGLRLLEANTPAPPRWLPECRGEIEALLERRATGSGD